MSDFLDRELAAIAAEQAIAARHLGYSDLTVVNLSEHQEQCLVVSWCNGRAHLDPRLNLLYACPNGLWAKNRGSAIKAKAEGLKKGVPDLFLPVASGGFHGLYIELKKIGGKPPSVEQKQWLQDLAAQGYCCEVCKGHKAAIAAIENYLKLGAITAKIVALNPDRDRARDDSSNYC